MGRKVIDVLKVSEVVKVIHEMHSAQGGSDTGGEI